ncbi:MAG: carboxypeptidase regulatory-like domain-containing protein [Desulfobulbaceae bacterium]|nr:carboxypeptidase regulatory-like domain-containing protein [Desulfobulbaceae bacterium]
MKRLLGLSLMVGLLFLSGCAITHEYGPYTGKVVEKETGAPIEGAVVFISFYTKLPTPGGPTSHYADATEVLTNGQGQFDIPAQRILSMKPLQYWDPQPEVTIFKPGYGAFPGQRDTTISPKDEWFPANKQITVQLPKLKTREERLDNLINIRRYSMDEVPCNKQRNIQSMYDIESISASLKPSKYCEGR